MVGCGFPQEKQGMNLARRAALLAGLPNARAGDDGEPLLRVLACRRSAWRSTRSRRARATSYVAAGVESISQVDGYPKDSEELHPEARRRGRAIANVYIPMGLTAENVAEQ